MSTTQIDNIIIDIESNSTSAVAAIDALSASLVKLKSAGSLGVAIKNLNNLAAAIKNIGSTASAANGIGALADAMTKLKSVGSVGSGVKKLSEALRSLSTVDFSALDKVANAGETFEKVAAALNKLGSVKVNGFVNAVNALGKIGKITDSLDDELIARFADRIKKLTEALTPLAQKLANVMEALKALGAFSKSAEKALANLDNGVKVTRLNLATLVTVIQGVVQAIMPLVRALANAIGSAMEWDGIEYQFGNAFGEQANEYYNQITKITKALGINKQAFMENSAMAASMLIGFGVNAQDAREMGVGYTELAYDIWAAFNNVYKTLDGADGAMAAVRSAIAGEVEPIRRAGFTIVDSQLEITAANYGIAYSTQNATEELKSYLRYLTLVDQAAEKGVIGTFANEMDTAEGLMRTFTQQLKSLSQAFGSLFLPAIVQVMPYINAFIEVLAEAVAWLGALFGVSIQPVDFSDYTTGTRNIGAMGEAAKATTSALGDTGKAVSQTVDSVKELKNAMIGIDELNVISPPTKGGGGGGATDPEDSGFAGFDVESIWDESIYGKVRSEVEALKNAIKEFLLEFETELKIIGLALGALSVAKLLSGLGEAIGLGEKFVGLMDNIAKIAVTGIVITVQYTLMSEFLENYIDGDGFKEYLKAALTAAISAYILRSMWGNGGLVIALAVTAVASLSAVFENGGITNTESAVTALTGIVSGLASVGLAVKLLGPILKGSDLWAFFDLLKEGNGLLPSLAAAFPKLATAIGGFVTSISGAVTAVGAFLAGISAPVWATIALVVFEIAAAIAFLVKYWDEMVAVAKRFFEENIVPKLEDIKDAFWKLMDTLGPVGDLIVSVFSGLWDSVERVFGNIKSAIDSVGSAFGLFVDVIGGVVVGLVGGILGGAITGILSFVEGAIKMIDGFIGIIVNTMAMLWTLMTEGPEAAREYALKVVESTVDFFAGLYDSTIGVVVEWVEGIIDWCRYMWDELVGHSIIPDTIDGIIECFLDLPGEVLGAVGDFVGNIIEKFSDFGSKILEKISSGWSKVKEWWGGKSGMENTEVEVSLVKKGWNTVKDWMGSIPSVSQAVELTKKGWSSLKSWLGSTSVISQPVSLVKSGWSTVKKWVGTTSVISQTVKLAKSGWSSVKSWVGSIPTVNQNVGLVKSGWSSVKNWIGSMPSLSAKIGLAKSGWTSIKSWLGNLNFNLGFKLPKVGIKWGTRKLFGWEISFPESFYTYAKGGFPDFGELFVAREAGPEMVGKIGSKTTVANNEQIVEGISEGVYAAVLAAMKASEGSSAQSVNVYLDSRQITSSVEKRQRERGASIMGNQVYAY